MNLIILVFCASCSIDLGSFSFSAYFLPKEIPGFQAHNMISGDGTDNDTCATVDMGDYYKINPDNSINRNENVSASVCQSSMPERKWKDRVDDLYKTSKEISSIDLTVDITGKYYSPFKKHVFILWRDGDFISHVSAISESGDADTLAMTVADAMIVHLKHLRETEDPFRRYRDTE